MAYYHLPIQNYPTGTCIVKSQCVIHLLRYKTTTIIIALLSDTGNQSKFYLSQSTACFTKIYTFYIK